MQQHISHGAHHVPSTRGGAMAQSFGASADTLFHPAASRRERSDLSIPGNRSPGAKPAVFVKSLPRVAFAREVGDTGVVFGIPRAKVVHWPACEHVEPCAPPLMCPAFLASGACPAGTACLMVHARGRGIRTHQAHIAPHIDKAWRPPSPVAAGSIEDAVAVAFPANSNVAAELVPRAACLPTKGFEREQPAHCVHYLRKGLCLLGAECQFVHAAEPSTAAVAWGMRSASKSPVGLTKPKPFSHQPYSAKPVAASERQAKTPPRVELPISIPFELVGRR